jgi:hypothetical protein
LAVLVYAVNLVPHQDVKVFVAVGGCVVVAVGGKGKPFAIVKTDVLGDFPARGGVPEFQDAVIGAGKDGSAVGAKGYGAYRPYMSFEGAEFPARGGVPEFQGVDI